MILAEFPTKGSKNVLQTNRSNILGTLWSSMGIDLQTNLGAVRCAPRLLLNTSVADQANLGVAVGFKEFDGSIFTVAGSRVFARGLNSSSSFIEDVSTGAVTTYSSDYSDINIFNDILFTTTTDKIYSLSQASGGSWSSRGNLTTSRPHITCYFQRQNRLYIQDSGIIYSLYPAYSFATSGDYTLTLGSEIVTCMKANSSSIFIGVLNVTEGGSELVDQISRGKIIEWDGVSAGFTNVYFIDAQGVLAMIIQDNIPYCMDSNGRFLKYTGSSFEEIGRLPCYNNLLSNLNTVINNRFIHPNGIVSTKNGTFLFAINNNNEDGTVNESFPSGIWEFSLDKGFVHKHSFTYTPIGSSTITDFGQNRISRIGGMAIVNIGFNTTQSNGTLLVGASYYTNASSTTNGIFYDDTNDTVQKKGYFVTTWIEADSIDEQFLRIWDTHRKFLNSNDKIVYKYRLYEDTPLYIDITWASTTTFTTTTDPTAYWTSAQQYGGEIEVLQGTGSSSCAHITNIVNNAGTYTVTLDTIITGVTNGTAKARLQSWIKVLPEITATIGSNNTGYTYGNLPIDDSESRIQVKGCFTFTGNDELYRMIITSGPNIKIT